MAGKNAEIVEIVESETMVIDEEPEAAAPVLDMFAFLPGNTQKLLDDIVTVDAPEGYNNPDGTRAQLKIRKLPYETLMEITDRNKKRTVIKERGRVMSTTGGRAAIDERSNSEAFTCELIAEALVFPDMRSQEFANAYGPFPPAEMTKKVFPTAEAFNYVALQVARIVNGTQDEDSLIEAAKN